MGFAENLRFLRKKNKLSQEFVANKLGYKSYTTVQKWETNNSEPSLEILHKIADLFTVSMNALVNGIIEDGKLVLPNGQEDLPQKYGRKSVPVYAITPTHNRIFNKMRLLDDNELKFVESIIDSYLEKKEE